MKSFMSVLWFFMVLGSDFYLLHSDKTLNIQQKITFVLRLMHVCGPKRKEGTKSIDCLGILSGCGQGLHDFYIIVSCGQFRTCSHTSASVGEV